MTCECGHVSVGVTWLIHMRVFQSSVKYEWVTSEIHRATPTIRMSDMSHMNESCLTYAWVMCHVRISHDTDIQSHTYYKHESYATYEGVMSHVRMSHVSHTNGSRHRYIEPHPLYAWVIYHTWMSHVSPKCHVHATCSYVRHDSFVYVPRLIHMWERCLICMWKRTHEYMTSDAFTRMNESVVTYAWVMCHIHMSHVSHTRESCFTYDWVICYSHMRHVSHMDNKSCVTHACVKSCATHACIKFQIPISHVSHMNKSCHTYEWVMPPISRTSDTTTSFSSVKICLYLVQGGEDA